MSGQETRAAKERFEICRNCRRWNRWDAEGLGRCGKFTRRNVMTLEHETCDNFKARTKSEASNE